MSQVALTTRGKKKAFRRPQGGKQNPQQHVPFHRICPLSSFRHPLPRWMAPVPDGKLKGAASGRQAADRVGGDRSRTGSGIGAGTSCGSF